MAFEIDVVPEDLRSAVIIPLYKSKGELIKCKNYRGISVLSVVGKIYFSRQSSYCDWGFD